MTAMIMPMIIMMTSSSTSSAISIKIIVIGTGINFDIGGTISACRTSSTTGIGIMISIRMPVVIDMSMIGITA
jgi:hypothetical protein